jgi:hypothetical protein
MPAMIAARTMSLLSGFLLVVASANANAGCPESCIRIPNVGTSCSPAAVRDTALTAVQTGHLCTDYFEARYDIPQATLFLTSGSPFGGCDPEITVEDDFVVHGLPDGTPVSFTGRFEVSAEYYCQLGYGGVSASLRAGVGIPASLAWALGQNDCTNPVPNSRAEVLTVPISGLAGSPIRMRFVLGATMGELFGANVLGKFGFDGLPNGTTIVSCNGFVDGPVPAQPASWGRLKAQYR